MPNEALILLSVVLIFGAVLLFYRLFGEVGLCCWMVFAIVAANIEVTMVVDAFGIEQTLGNVFFASTCLATDILSETVGRKSANKAVAVSVLAGVLFFAVTQSWLLFTPSENDIVHSAVEVLFANTPRYMLVSFAVFALVQVFDVFAYHFIWERTTKRFGDSTRFLWLRNNVATMLSQLLNTVLFTFFAFYGIYSNSTLVEIGISTFVIYIFTSLLDTPFVYLARRMHLKSSFEENQ